MVRTVITGVSGRMGATLARLVRDSGGAHVLAGVTERPDSPFVGRDAGEAARTGALGMPVSGDLEALLRGARADVVVDFTSPEATLAHARVCAAARVPLVVGTTGLSDAQRAELAEIARAAAVVAAPNMSVGVNVVLRAAAQLARLLGEGYDVEVVETHHRMKKDAPSGTALRLAEDVAAALGRTREDLVLAREGQVGARTQREIGVQALRGGDVVGEHTVFFFGEGERVELTHRATSRDQFASGALRAARWAVTQRPGLYDMADVLGLPPLPPPRVRAPP